MQTVTVGPAQGSLTLHTGVEGKAARTGHTLTIALGDWLATATMNGDTPESVELVAQLVSLEVLSGEGGLKPLSDKDRTTIRDNALKTLKAARHPEITFRSTSVRKANDGWTLLGDLTIGGTTRQSAVDVAVTPGAGGRRVAATSSVVQTEHAISPYSALMGALRVSDRVGVTVDVTVPLP